MILRKLSLNGQKDTTTFLQNLQLLLKL